jgi:hypothetical protein
LLAEEEAATLKKKATPKAGSKKAAKPAGPGAIAAADAADAPAESAEPSSKSGGEPEEIESFAATGIDNVLDLVDVVTAKMDKASVGNQAATTVEKHPEVRAPIVFELVVASDIPMQRRFKVPLFFFQSGLTSCLRRLKAAFNAYVDRELPIIRAEVRGPSPRFAGSALTVVMFTATRATPTAI